MIDCTGTLKSLSVEGHYKADHYLTIARRDSSLAGDARVQITRLTTERQRAVDNGNNSLVAALDAALEYQWDKMFALEDSANNAKGWSEYWAEMARCADKYN